MSCESFILLHEMQTKLMAFDKLKKESPAKQLARKAKALLDNEATIVRCDDCGGTGYQKQDCECYPFNPNGCALCDYKGWTKIPCPTCKEQGEVLMYKNGKVEALI